MTRIFIGSLNIPGPWFHATGEGITACDLNEETGEIFRVSSCSNAENAIWLTRAGGTLLVASERYLEPGEISAFDSKDFTRIGHVQSTLGGAICHIALSSNRRAAVVSNYLGGVTVHALGASGEVAAAHQHIVYPGHGSDLDRQEKSHPHQAAFAPDGRHVLVCDLGCDCVWLHAFDGKHLGEARAIAVAPGSGPRHLVFHPALPRFYVLGELDAKLRVLEGNCEDWREIAVHATLPETFADVPAGAALEFHPSGKSLFVSNRHSDTAVCFAVDTLGDLALAGSFSVRGKTPRDIALSPSGRWLLSVNQDSHEVVPFELDPATGQPTGTHGPVFPCGSPCCAVF
ncbi:lactonase family protein [Luteolibacter arcticus]|uniref:Lactonase family protein n=1 Tax=Luteolibacter arcticus TaxID=1581411 RepID=A0ABT3GI07_9BACT|nr:lactonase family protein [Luteolibacter arcticus]MCW1923153.1 lactonase family protein [Luteolibacter arcticus]